MDDRELLNLIAQQPRTCLDLASLSYLSQPTLRSKFEQWQRAGLPISVDSHDRWCLDASFHLLDSATIYRAISTSHSHVINQLEIVWSVDSTNTQLLARSVPLTGVNVLLAEHQHAGRGRRGRQWSSPMAAHIYASVSRVFSGGNARLPGLSIVTGIAVADALKELLPSTAITLKWPNDIFVADRKLAGILIEGKRCGPNTMYGVIGIGVNVRMPDAFAAEIDQPWIDLETLAGHRIDRNQTIGSILNQLIPAFELYENEGIMPFLNRFRELDALHGRDVDVIETRDGRCRSARVVGISEDGGLLLAYDGAEHVVYSGEVSIRQ